MRWLKANGFVYDEPNHDYIADQDYNVVEANKKTKKFVDGLVREWQGSLFKELGVFRSITVEYVDVGRGDIAIYAFGTYSHPVIMIDEKETLKALKEYKMEDDWELAIETSILHEIAHALQEYKDKPLDETEAEDFAYAYYNYGQINKI